MIIKKISDFLTSKGFNLKELDCEGDSILLFWNDGYKYLGEYNVIYAIFADVGCMQIGYLHKEQREKNIVADYIRKIYWGDMENDEIFHTIIEETKEIRKYAINIRETFYLDEDDKSKMLFDDVQTAIDEFMG